jgi:hypothetical protein
MRLHLDWYDRRILSFVLDWAPQPEPPNDESLVNFGINSRRVMRRFDAVVDVFDTIALEEADQNLLRRAADFRPHVPRQPVGH